MTYDQYTVMVSYLALTLAWLGCIDQARARTNQALSEARRLQHATALAQALMWACAAEWVAGSPHDVQRHSEELVALSSEQSFPLWLGRGMIDHGWSLTALGKAQEGVALLTRGLAALRATGAVVLTPRALIMLAEADAKLGQLVEGQDCLAEAAQIIEATGDRESEAELHRVRGDLLHAAGDRAAAEQSYHQALAVAQRQSAKPFELRAATNLARLWRDQGKHTEAYDLLAPVYDWFTEGFDTPVLQEAKALLEQLSA